MPPVKTRKEIYIYSDSVTLAASATGQITFQVASTFDFFMTGFSYISSINSANGIPTFDILLQKNELNMFKDYTSCEMFAGVMKEISTAPDTRYVMGLTNWFPVVPAFCFEAKSTIIVNLRDTSGQANTIRFSIKGYKKIYL